MRVTRPPVMPDTATNAPYDTRVVAVEIGVLLVVVGGAQADDDAVADVGPHATGVGVVWRAHPVEGGVVAVLVAIDLLPVAGRRAGERILVGVGGGEEPERQRARGRGCAGADAEPAQEVAPRSADLIAPSE
jgi:hypothetical protein